MRPYVLITLLSLLALLPTLTAAYAKQPKTLKVYISADMEGVSGVMVVEPTPAPTPPAKQ